jgi:hypothetical protein
MRASSNQWFNKYLSQWSNSLFHGWLSNNQLWLILLLTILLLFAGMYNFWDYKNGHSHSLMALSVVYYQSLVSEVVFITKMANVMNRNEVMLHVGSKQVPSNVNSNFSTINLSASIIENLQKSNIYCEKVLDVNGPSRDSWKARTFVRILWKEGKLDCFKEQVIRNVQKHSNKLHLKITLVYFLKNFF